MDGAAQLLGLAHASERRLANHVLSALGVAAVGVGEQGAVLLGDEESWGYGIHADALAELSCRLVGHVSREV